MRTVAVIGGTGFLGRHVVSALQEAGFAARVLSRRNGFDALRPDPELLRGSDAVVNLAGIKREEGEQTFQSVHVDLVRQLVSAMKQTGIRRLIHISVVVARPAPELPYHDSKWKGEEIIRSSGLDYTILRPGVIYGEGDDMLSHLALMIRTAPIFPIVGTGASPMRPVDARDVATAVVKSLERECSGKTLDIVGPDRLELREVVRQVAAAMELPLRILPTPAFLMRIPVRIMEAFMEQPLSTRAQLDMLEEGLDGNPEPARKQLGLTTAPFTVARLQPLLAKKHRPLPFNLRLFSAPPLRREISTSSFLLLLLPAIAALSLVFAAVPDRWMGMTVVMGLSLVAALGVPAVRHRLKPSVWGVTIGVATGLALYAASNIAASFLFSSAPSWESAALELYRWSVGHSPLFIVLTLPMIVLAEEVLWRGVVTRFLIERYGRGAGILFAAVIYAAAHAAAFNPVLLLAAFGCGLYWGWLYSVTDDLVAPTVSHLLWDILLLFVLPVVDVG